MPRPRLLITQRIFPDLVEQARRSADVDYREEDGPIPTPDLLRRLAGCQGLVCASTDRIGSDVLSVPGLRVVSNIAVGYNNIDVAAATQRGIVVTNTPGVLDET